MSLINPLRTFRDRLTMLCLAQSMEVCVSTEIWADERERLVKLLRDYESGKITHLDEDETGQLRRETTAERIAAVKHRLAELDAKLGLDGA
jgi:hypothetical protein